MTGAWKVTSNMIAGVKKFSCYRLKDIAVVDHSGNREELGEWFATEAEARAMAVRRNEEEEARG